MRRTRVFELVDRIVLFGELDYRAAAGERRRALA